MSKSAKVQYFFVLVLLVVGAFYGGYYFGGRGFEVRIKRNPPAIVVENKEPKEQNVDFKIFWEVWDVLNNNYIDRPLDGKKLIYGAVSGMVSAAGDDYTSFFTPVQNEIAVSSLNGQYEGIGAELGFKDKQLVIISPIEGSPAQTSGVKPGDKIIEIEGASTLGISMSEAVSKIRGASGTVSTLKLQRGDAEPFEIKIVRGKILSKSVSWKDLGDGISYIRLARFGENTATQWTDVVNQIRKEMPNLKGIILDVRGNPGGYLNAATYVSSEFLKKGSLVLVEQHADSSFTEFKVERQGYFIGMPLVVLIDKGSASASEIVSGALRDNLKTKLVGSKSFGKGSIQSSKEFDDKSSLHVTIAKWLTPNKTWVHKVGMEPDVVVEFSEEDYKNGKDPQLEKAKEVIKEEVAYAKK